MKPRHTALLIALFALPIAAGGDRLQSAAIDSPPANAHAKSPAFAAGQILVLDPSGKISPAQLSSDLQLVGSVFSTSSEGLVVEKSRVAGGGIMVNLQGRFQNAMTMSVDSNGHTTSACVPAARQPAGTSGGVK